MTSRNNHAPRDTSTGKVNEADIEQFLSENFNHSVYPQAEVGTQFSTGKKHIVDVLLGGSAYKKNKTAKRLLFETAKLIIIIIIMVSSSVYMLLDVS